MHFLLWFSLFMKYKKTYGLFDSSLLEPLENKSDKKVPLDLLCSIASIIMFEKCQ